MNETLTSGLEEFAVLFPDEESCVEEIYRRLSAQRRKCKYCNADLERAPGTRSAKCGRCRNETFLTAGTVFHGVWALRPWLAAIWLLERGISFNSHQLHLELQGIAYSTARNILLKIAQVVESAFPAEVQAQPSSLFSVLFARRSKETPAREPPIAEESSITEQRSTEQEDQSLPSAYEELDEPQQTLLVLLNAKEEKHIDALSNELNLPVEQVSAALVMLELDGFVKRVAGDRYVRLETGRAVADSASEETTRAITKLCFDLRRQFHGISRKYLQLYLIWHWCIRPRGWRKGGLLSHCVNSTSWIPMAIDEYVTPSLVKFVA
jgi:DNA-binding MarR family transcriptional regulator